MDKSTNEVRTLSWAAIIEQCQARPEGQSAKQWLKANGISEKQYYYWLRKLRKQAYEQSFYPIQSCIYFRLKLHLPRSPQTGYSPLIRLRQ